MSQAKRCSERATKIWSVRSYREVRGEALYAEIAPHMAAALAGRTVSFDGTWSVGEQTYHYQSSYVPDVPAQWGGCGLLRNDVRHHCAQGNSA